MGVSEEGFSIILAFLNFAELGAEWVMWVMLAMGFVLIVLAIERIRLFNATKVDAPALARDLTKLLRSGQVDEARKLFERGVAMEERVLADALESYDQGAAAVGDVIAGSLARERQRFNRFLTYMATVGSNAPFIGLFGTVIGIIVAFKQLGENPKGGLEIVGPAIAEALVATAVGLLVAIPGVIFFNVFKATVRDRVGNTEFLGRLVLSSLNSQAERAGDGGAS